MGLFSINYENTSNGEEFTARNVPESELKDTTRILGSHNLRIRGVEPEERN